MKASVIIMIILCIFCLLPSIGLGLFAIFDDDEDNGSCVSPIDEKYDFSNASGSYKIDSFKITGIECQDGYSGSVNVTKCNASGSPYNVSGCIADSKCTSTFPVPTDNTYKLIDGVEITNYAINSLKTLNSGKNCSGTGNNVSCNWDINASGVISCSETSASGNILCNSSGIFELKNCSGVPTGGEPTGDDPTGGEPTGDVPTGGEPTGDDPTQPTRGVCAGTYGNDDQCGFGFTFKSLDTNFKCAAATCTVAECCDETPFHHRFTNCDKTGMNGPTLAECTGFYGGSGNWWNNPDNFNVIDGIQVWTVPKTGDYQIEAAGASGGDGADFDTEGKTGGKGAVMGGTFNLLVGNKYMILIGQQGSVGYSYPYGSGGGGGTFFLKGEDYQQITGPYETDNEHPSNLLIAAGGGAGAPRGCWGLENSPLYGGNTASDMCDLQTSEYGDGKINADSTCTYPDSDTTHSSAGGNGSPVGAGGGGGLKDKGNGGFPWLYAEKDTYGRAIISGGAGGYDQGTLRESAAEGGFGGGGGAAVGSPGGGGGCFGGDAGMPRSDEVDGVEDVFDKYTIRTVWSYGKGGGSHINPIHKSSISSVVRSDTGHGYLTITAV